MPAELLRPQIVRAVVTPPLVTRRNPSDQLRGLRRARVTDSA